MLLKEKARHEWVRYTVCTRRSICTVDVSQGTRRSVTKGG